MEACSKCKKPDYPLDEINGLCYECWTIVEYEKQQILAHNQGEEE